MSQNHENNNGREDWKNEEGVGTQDLASEDDEKKRMDRREALHKIIVWILVLISGILGVRKSCIESSENPGVYLGTWKGTLAGDRITIKKLSSDYPERPLEEINVGKEEASLLMPINTPNMPFGKIGGIYKMDDKHLLVLWCDTCQSNVVMGISQSEEGLLVGIPDTFPDSIKSQMCCNHTDRHRRYNPSKWLKYKLISK